MFIERNEAVRGNLAHGSCRGTPLSPDQSQRLNPHTMLMHTHKRQTHHHRQNVQLAIYLWYDNISDCTIRAVFALDWLLFKRLKTVLLPCMGGLRWRWLFSNIMSTSWMLNVYWQLIPPHRTRKRYIPNVYCCWCIALYVNHK